jgi:hypothetical protein
MTPSSACTSCGRERNLVAVERLANRAYVLRTFRCASCRSELRLVGPTAKETDSAYRRRQAALRHAGLAAREKAPVVINADIGVKPDDV